MGNDPSNVRDLFQLFHKHTMCEHTGDAWRHLLKYIRRRQSINLFAELKTFHRTLPCIFHFVFQTNCHLIFNQTVIYFSITFSLSFGIE